MTRSHRSSPLIGVIVTLFASAVLAAGLSGADAVKDRQAHMKALGAAAKALGEQLHAAAPDPVIVKIQAAKIDEAAKGLPGWFPAGSGEASGVKTQALNLIWSDPAGFATKQRAFAAAAARLNAAAQSGDTVAVGLAMQAVGGGCKGCHETYKAKDKT
jgi:cytochrome c556